MIINDPFPKIIQGVVVASCRYQYHIVLFSLLSQVVCPEIDRNDHWAGQRRQSQCFIPRNNWSENSWSRTNLSTTVHHSPPLSCDVSLTDSGDAIFSSVETAALNNVFLINVEEVGNHFRKIRTKLSYLDWAAATWHRLGAWCRVVQSFLMHKTCKYLYCWVVISHWLIQEFLLLINQR